MECLHWFFSLFFSLIIGGLVTALFVQYLRSTRKDADPIKREKFEGFIKEQDAKIIRGVPAWLMGILERLFFTILIGTKISGAGVAMMTWLVVKMASNWQRITCENADVRNYGIAALLGGMMSMVFALIGGLGYRDPTWWCFTGEDLTMGTKWLHVILILLALAGIIMAVLGLKIRKKDSAIEQCPFLINLGLLFISVAAFIELWMIFCLKN